VSISRSISRIVAFSSSSITFALHAQHRRCKPSARALDRGARDARRQPKRCLLHAQGSALADLSDLSLFILTRLTSRRIFFSCAAYSGGYRPGAPSSSPQKIVALPLIELKSAAPVSAVRPPRRHAAALPNATAATIAQATTATSALTRLCA
jgi:hypothetical protein